jgi:hypothetical protein
MSRAVDQWAYAHGAAFHGLQHRPPAQLARLSDAGRVRTRSGGEMVVKKTPQQSRDLEIPLGFPLSHSHGDASPIPDVAQEIQNQTPSATL